jgi:hypothetical protein
MILLPISRQPCRSHQISAWAAVLARTNKLAMAINRISITPNAAGMQRVLVALSPTRDLLFCAKDLFVAAMGRQSSRRAAAGRPRRAGAAPPPGACTARTVNRSRPSCWLGATPRSSAPAHCCRRCGTPCCPPRGRWCAVRTIAKGRGADPRRLHLA